MHSDARSNGEAFWRFLKGTLGCLGSFVGAIALTLAVGLIFQMTIVGAVAGLLLYILIFVFPFAYCLFVAIFLLRELLRARRVRLARERLE